MDLKYRRTLMGKSMTEIANAVGISKQSYYRIEKDGIATTKEKTARKIAKALDCNVFELCDESVLKIKPKSKAEWQLLIAFLNEREGEENA